MDKSNIKFLESPTDLAIALFRHSVANPDDNSIDGLTEELEFPRWNSIIEKIRLLWKKNYANSIKILQNKSEIDSHISNFENEIKKMFAKRQEYINWEKYFLHVINHELDEIKDEIFNGATRKVARTTPAPAEATQADSKNLYSYDLVNFIRCHSRNGNYQDDCTEVYDAAFEPAPSESGKFTNLCATCGGYIINFIDVKTGEVVKRFNDELVIDRSKEKYYQLAWSVINGQSVLAAAGLHGQIKVIIPQQSACVLRISAHNKPINSLIFHNKHREILFSASEDKRISICRIYFDSTSNKYKYNPIAELNYEAVLSMCIFCDYLLFSTLYKRFYIKLDDELLVQNSSESLTNEKIILEANELAFDMGDLQEEVIVNKLIAVNDLLVANLVYSSSILIFKIHKNKDASLTLKFQSSIDIGSKLNWLNSTINLFEDDGKFFILKATDMGFFYKIELDKNTLKRNNVLKLKIPTDYSVRCKSSHSTASVKNHDLLETAKLFTCVTNVDYIVSTTNKNLVTIWSKAK